MLSVNQPNSGTSRRNRIFAAVSWVFLLLVAASAISYAYGHRHELAKLQDVSLGFLILSLALHTLTIEAKGVSLALLVKVFKTNLERGEYIGLAAVSILANYGLPLQAGLGFKTLYLQKVRRINYIEFLPLTTGSILIATGIYTVMALFGCIWDYLRGATVDPMLVTMLAGFTATTVVLWLFPTPQAWFKGRVGALLGRAIQGWIALKNDRRLFGYWVVSVVFRAILDVLALTAVFAALGIELEFSRIWILALAKEVSMLIKLTPGSLGVTEGLVIYLCVSWGLSPAQGLLVGGLARLVSFLPVFVLGCWYYLFLSKRLRNA